MIHKMSGGIESFDPVGAGHAGVKEESANAVVDCPESAFGLPILGGGVRTRETESDSVSGKVRAKGMIVEFTSIVG
jgi:hypothetical protein